MSIIDGARFQGIYGIQDEVQQELLNLNPLANKVREIIVIMGYKMDLSSGQL